MATKSFKGRTAEGSNRRPAANKPQGEAVSVGTAAPMTRRGSARVAAGDTSGKTRNKKAEEPTNQPRSGVTGSELAKAEAQRAAAAAENAPAGPTDPIFARDLTASPLAPR